MINPAPQQPKGQPVRQGLSRAGKTANSGKELVEPEKNAKAEAFRRWFGNSKVVGADGKPLVVYHGTKAKRIAAFKAEPHDIRWSENGVMKDIRFSTFNFTNSSDVAATYGPTVIQVYLSIQNPKIINARGSTWDNFMPFNKAAQAFVDKHDGLIVKNIRDEASGGGERSTVFIVFNPKQINIKKPEVSEGLFSDEDRKSVLDAIFGE